MTFKTKNEAVLTDMNKAGVGGFDTMNFDQALFDQTVDSGIVLTYETKNNI